jgi:hypothetical protein
MVLRQRELRRKRRELQRKREAMEAQIAAIRAAYAAEAVEIGELIAEDQADETAIARAQADMSASRGAGGNAAPRSTQPRTRRRIPARTNGHD